MSVLSESMSYELDDALTQDVLPAVDPGTNILLIGRAMSGKRHLVLELMEQGVAMGEGAIIVTSRDPATEFLEEYPSAIADTDTFFRIIDTVGSPGGGGQLSGITRNVNSPGNLTGIGMEFSEVAQTAGDEGVERLRISFDSLSPLLRYVDLQGLFRFLHVFTSQIQSRNWLGLFTMDPDSHEEQVINTVSQLFDGMLEIRVSDAGARQVRARGFADATAEWVNLE